MTRQRSGAPPVRMGAAPGTFPAQRVGPANSNTTGQFQLQYDETLSTAQRFELFHRDNPHVYRLLVDLAREWKIATNGQNLGMRCLWEQLRWRVAVKTVTADYRLNDHFPPYYARLIEHQEPDLRGLFELRKSAEADAWIKKVTA